MGLAKRIGTKASVAVGSFALIFKLRSIGRAVIATAVSIRLAWRYAEVLIDTVQSGSKIEPRTVVDLVIALETITECLADVAHIIGLDSWEDSIRKFIVIKD